MKRSIVSPAPEGESPTYSFAQTPYGGPSTSQTQCHKSNKLSAGPRKYTASIFPKVAFRTLLEITLLILIVDLVAARAGHAASTYVTISTPTKGATVHGTIACGYHGKQQRKLDQCLRRRCLDSGESSHPVAAVFDILELNHCCRRQAYHFGDRLQVQERGDRERFCRHYRPESCCYSDADPALDSHASFLPCANHFAGQRRHRAGHNYCRHVRKRERELG